MRDVFIEGININLSLINIEQDITLGNWHSWFNNEKITKYLYHGVFPNSREKQKKITEENLNKHNIVLLGITDKKTNLILGVISFKNIDLINRIAEIGIVMGINKYPMGAPFEAMGLMTAYGFERLNLNKIKAGQHEGLWKWVNQLELLGYKLEGYVYNTHIRYGVISNSVTMGINSNSYFKLKETRNNNYLTDDIPLLLSKRRKENMCDKLKKIIENLYED